jgi:putative ABC transport system ATP-binding protein
MINVKNVTKIYTIGQNEVRALDDVTMEIKDGEFVVIIGPSGSGKSTLLYQLSALDNPTSGQLIFDSVILSDLAPAQLGLFRLHNLGYIFQDYAIIPELTALENVMLPILMQGCYRHQAKDFALAALTQVGLEGRVDNLSSQLSGGEQQRVAVARAIVNKPRVIFADEPTANLDSVKSRQILDLLVNFNKNGQTVVMVTHEMEYANLAGRIIEIKDGKITSQT